VWSRGYGENGPDMPQGQPEQARLTARDEGERKRESGLHSPDQALAVGPAPGRLSPTVGRTPWSRTGENPPYGILEGVLETERWQIEGDAPPKWRSTSQASLSLNATALALYSTRESLVRNWGDPTWRPTLGEGGTYKPSAKGDRAERESEGLTVPVKAGKTCWRERALLWSRPRLGVSARACP